MLGRLGGGLGDDRHTEAAADHAGDVSERHALVGHPMEGGTRRTLLKHKPVEMGNIEPVHRRPAVVPVAHIRRNALFSRDADQCRNEAVIALAMDGRREAHHRPAHPRETSASAASSDLRGKRELAASSSVAKGPRR
jgi:hypothetical protein